MSSHFLRVIVLTLAAAALATPAAAQAYHHGRGLFHAGGFGFHGGHGDAYGLNPFAGYPVPYTVYGPPPPFRWYCPNPPGYYPALSDCPVVWQPVPVGQHN
jgi:hypothetical protein